MQPTITPARPRPTTEVHRAGSPAVDRANSLGGWPRLGNPPRALRRWVALAACSLSLATAWAVRLEPLGSWSAASVTNPPPGQVITTGVISEIGVLGTYAYAAAGPAGLHILDCSDPTQPRWIGNVRKLHTQICRILPSSPFALLHTDQAQLQVLDLSNPTQPTVKGSVAYDTTTEPEAPQFFQRGAYVYGVVLRLVDPITFARQTEVQVFDLTDPSRPLAGDRVRSIAPLPTVWLSGDYLIGLPEAPAPTVFLDLADPMHPRWVTGSAPAGFAAEIAAHRAFPQARLLHGTLAFQTMLLGDEIPGLGVFEVADPALAYRKAFLPLRQAAANVTLAAPYAFLPQGSLGFTIARFVETTGSLTDLRVDGPDRTLASNQIKLRATSLFDDGSEEDATRRVTWEIAARTADDLALNEGVLTYDTTLDSFQVTVEARLSVGNEEVATQRRLTVESDSPTPQFSWSREPATSGSGVDYRFIAADSVPADAACRWIFPNGTRSEERTARFHFEAPGTYAVTLAIRRPGGTADRQATRLVAVEIPAAGEPPSAQPLALVPGRVFDTEVGEVLPPFVRTDVGLVVIATPDCAPSEDPICSPVLRLAIQAARAAQGQPAPRIVHFSWSDPAPTAYVSSAAEFADDVGPLRARLLAQGQALAAWLTEVRQFGQLPAQLPIHLIGEGVGGLIVAECAAILSQGSTASWTVNQVTLLDTPHPARRHFDDYVVRGRGRLERYVSSAWGSFAPKLDGPLPGWFARYGSLVTFGPSPDPSGRAVEPVDSQPLPRAGLAGLYHRTEIPDIAGADDLNWNRHDAATRWYAESAQANPPGPGYGWSPWSDGAFPVIPAPADGSGATPGRPPATTALGDWTPFGNAARDGEAYTLTERDNSGVSLRLALPLGAQAVRFRFQFVTPGDGDFLALTWGTNAVLAVGLDTTLSRAGWIELEASVAPFAGQTGDLVAKLVHRGQAQAVARVTGFTLSTTTDPDLDGLETSEELQLGTEPLRWDSDGDGAADGDEVKRLSSDPRRADTDADGSRDGDEVVLGTSPIDPASVFQAHVVRLTDGPWQMEWPGQTNRTYRVRSRSRIDTRLWRTEAEAIPGRVPQTVWTIPMLGETSRFYWVESR